MQGIELSRRFYAEIVRPFLDAAAPGLRHAAALVGYGSELLGFDDATSRDHNWGPRVLVIVSQADFETHARRLVDGFLAVAPAQFLGEPIGWQSRPHPAPDAEGALGRIEHGLELHTLEALSTRLVGIGPEQPLTSLDWLGLAEQRLLTLTAGAVFHDDDGRLTALRQRLDWYPDDVFYYRLAGQWRRIAEEQAFVGRTGQVGDDLGSRVIAARLVRDVMRLAFLLERTYAPYPKWFGSGFARLPIAARLTPLLDAALAAPHWQPRGEALAKAYLALANHQVASGIAPFSPVIGPYYERPFVTINADDAVAAARAAITDPALIALETIGALDQLTDLTPVLESPDLSRRLMRTALGGSQA